MKNLVGGNGDNSCIIGSCKVVIMDGGQYSTSLSGYCTGQLVEVNNGGWTPDYQLNCWCQTSQSYGAIQNKSGQSNCGNY